jgi:hypothetical protein
MCLGEYATARAASAAGTIMVCSKCHNPIFPDDGTKETVIESMSSCSE